MKLCPEQNLVEMSWIVWGNIIEKQTMSVCVYTSRSDWSHIWEILEKLVALAGKRTQASPGAGDNSTTEPPALMLAEEENMWRWNLARSWNLAATDEDVTRTFHLPSSSSSFSTFAFPVPSSSSPSLPSPPPPPLSSSSSPTTSLFPLHLLFYYFYYLMTNWTPRGR